MKFSAWLLVAATTLAMFTGCSCERPLDNPLPITPPEVRPEQAVE